MDLVGESKSGFTLHLELAPAQLVLRSRPDARLLYLVLGAALLLGLLGAVLAAPTREVLEAGLFVALFSPIALFLMLSALGLRAVCTVDRERNSLRWIERSYLGERKGCYSLEQVGNVFLFPGPPGPSPGASRAYLLCLAVPEGAYLVAEGPSRDSLEPTARTLARFLGVALDQNERAVVSVGRPQRLLVAVLLYAAPVTAAITVLGLSIPPSGAAWVFPTTMTAIVLSQVGAILALLYYRRRGPTVAALPEEGPLADEARRPLTLGKAE